MSHGKSRWGKGGPPPRRGDRDGGGRDNRGGDRYGGGRDSYRGRDNFRDDYRGGPSRGRDR